MSQRVLHYLAYATLLGFMSKFAQLWWSERRRRIRDANTGSSREIADVIFINEQSHACYQNHALPLQSKSPNKLQLADIVKDCQNPYCALQNVARLVHYIDQAKSSIDAAMYTFSSHDLANAMQRASHRGVVVRLITDKAMSKALCNQLKTDTLMQLRYNNAGMLMHHKFCIIDSPGRATALNKTPKEINQLHGVLINGSLNWTNQGIGGNWENCVITSNQTFVRIFEEEFERLWNLF